MVVCFDISGRIFRVHFVILETHFPSFLSVLELLHIVCDRCIIYVRKYHKISYISLLPPKYFFVVHYPQYQLSTFKKHLKNLKCTKETMSNLNLELNPVMSGIFNIFSNYFHFRMKTHGSNKNRVALGKTLPVKVSNQYSLISMHVFSQHIFQKTATIFRAKDGRWMTIPKSEASLKKPSKNHGQ